MVMSCVNVCIKGNINMRGITFFFFFSYFVNVSNVIGKKLLLYEFTDDTTFIVHSQYTTSRIHMSAFTRINSKNQAIRSMNSHLF